MSLASQTSQYNLTPFQSAALSAPQEGQNFAEINQVFTTDNSSTQAHWGLSSREQQEWDAANYNFFNTTLALGVDCARTNEAAGRPNAAGGACYPASISAQKAAMQLDANYNAYAPSAEQVVLAEGDIRYAPARQTRNNYVSPALSDFTFQPRLMGTRDTLAPGCASTEIDQTLGNSTACGLTDDLALPYYSSEDPRTLYGVDEPHSAYWNRLQLGGYVPNGCTQMSNDYQFDSSMCNLQSVEPGAAPRMPAQYPNDQAVAARRRVRCAVHSGH
jgi:hypothetical protein